MLFPLLAACAANAPTWQKAGAGESAINEDLQQCRVQARLAPDPSIFASPAVQNSGTPMIDRGQERDAKEDQQVRACMQAKGYSLTKR
jgi:hypothetical protein